MKTNVNLTEYSALLGESFSSKIDMLEHAIGSVHYPSLGSYKERLLISTIKTYIPQRYSVGTGFVIFPIEETDPAHPEHFDHLNQSAYTTSHQCDIIIYDASDIPVIFRDEDFVVLRPESVKAVIEVKGTASSDAISDVLRKFFDFGVKWESAATFYNEHQYGRKLYVPELYAIAWSPKHTKKGSYSITPSGIRKKIASFYKERSEFPAGRMLPILDRFFVYNTCIITALSALYEDEKGALKDDFGWSSESGRFVRTQSDGTLYYDKDRTVSTLLACLHVHLNFKDFNRYFSYADEVKNTLALKYDHGGFSAAWPDVLVEQAAAFNSRNPR